MKMFGTEKIKDTASGRVGGGRPMLMDELDRAKAAAEIRDKCAQRENATAGCATDTFPYDRRFEIVQKQLSEQKQTTNYLLDKIRGFGTVLRELLKAQGLEVEHVPEHLEVRKATKPRCA